jgi:outer membrane protein assembly factor BamB
VSGSRVYTAAGGAGGAAEAYDATTGARAWQLRGDGNGQAITLMGSKVYVGGHFNNFAGQRRPYFAAADAATGTLDVQWSPSGGGTKLSEVASTGVWDLVADELRGRLYAGTNCSTVNGRPHAGFVQFAE